MKLEVGMYIRYIPTQGEYTQKISKITKMENRILDMGYQLDNEKDLVFSCHFDQIINASHNIIDLIEVGDYVNGSKVIDFIYCGGGFTDRRKQGVRVDGEIWAFDYDEIKSIVTREQFERMAYKVVE